MYKKPTPKQRLKSILVDDNAFDLFGSQEEINQELESACNDFLLSLNYRVLPPLQDTHTIKGLKDLRQLFYSLAARKYHGKFANLGRGNTMDTVIMRNFLKSRMKEHTTKKNALIECANIMETVFNYSDELGITGQITMGMFDPGLFSWIVEKALKVLNGDIELKENRYVEDLVEKACDNMDVSWAMFDLKEENDGGKEEGS